MQSSLMRTAVVTSIVTALAVSAIAMYVAPRFKNPSSPLEGMQPAVYTGNNQNDSAQAPSQLPSSNTPQLHRRTAVNRQVSSASPSAAATTTTHDAYGEPVRRHRSTETSALIVAGSAGTGAAIGAIAGGGKGAAIGALSGGAAGFIYDRFTANK